ncbi:MAG TPA: hypothetical protein IAB06_02950 [Candidatus Avacidaminococcus intestinavium]|uniref:Bacterial Ig-like domain-containing protein n=1 Tax=Candidatus Avacidaminococcus intestinavium TaxID=2840684 RepID=A0A9D1MPN7_9FIRM|nr:hypothetical protein [Candidatus Avacidaminococcus intestinavium]
MKKVVVVKVKNDQQEVAQKEVVVKSSVEGAVLTEPLVIKAEAGAQYEFINKDTGRYSKHIIVKHVDNDLWVFFTDEGNTTETPDVIIESYYDYPSDSLFGLSGKGSAYEYVPVEDSVEYTTASLPDNDTLLLHIERDNGGAAWLWPALAAGGIGAAIGSGSDDDCPKDTTPPNITVEVPDVTNDTTPVIKGTTDAPEGSTVTVMITPKDGGTPIEIKVTVDEKGNYKVDFPEGTEIPEGPFDVTAKVTDPAGNEGTAIDNGMIDTIAPSITVEVPEETNDKTPTITGTTDAKDGSIIELTITDQADKSQTVQTVAKDGNYKVVVTEELAEGKFDVTAKVTDPAGNEGTAKNNGVIDTTAPKITVDVPENTNDTTPSITGHVDGVEPGTTVTLTIKPKAGEPITLTTITDGKGDYSVSVPDANKLPEGDFDVTAKVTDPAGNEGTAIDNGMIDTIAPKITVDVPENTNDTTPEITGHVDSVEPGTTVTLTIKPKVGEPITLTATTDVKGDYSVSVPDANKLPEGDFEVTAKVTDPAGNTATAKDDGMIDTTKPEITVEVPDVTGNNKTPDIIGKVTGVDANTPVKVVVTLKGGGTPVELDTITDEDGNYKVTLPENLPEGDFDVVAKVTDPAGNTATDDGNGVIDTIAPSITVDVPDVSNNKTPEITGTTDAPEGSKVTLVITDNDGKVIETIENVEVADGKYTATPKELPEGNFEVTAKVTDPAGNEGTAIDSGLISAKAPTITVIAPDDVNDATPEITGTTDAPEGSKVTLVIKDNAGNVIETIENVEVAGGKYIATTKELPEGDFTVEATVEDGKGNSATATDSGSVDLLPEITVEVPEKTDDSTPEITGTVKNVPEGSDVTITITPEDGSGPIEVKAKVDDQGNYKVTFPEGKEIPEGDFDVNVSVQDIENNTAINTGKGSVDLLPEITVEVPEKTSDITPEITGTVKNVPEGKEVSITINKDTDKEITFTAKVEKDGTYKAEVPSELTEGEFKVEVSVQDKEGNTAINTDTGVIELGEPPVAPTAEITIGDGDADKIAAGKATTIKITFDQEIDPATFVSSDIKASAEGVTNPLGSFDNLSAPVLNKETGKWEATVEFTPSEAAHGKEITFTIKDDSYTGVNQLAGGGTTGATTVNTPPTLEVTTETETIEYTAGENLFTADKPQDNFINVTKSGVKTIIPGERGEALSLHNDNGYYEGILKTSPQIKLGEVLQLDLSWNNGWYDGSSGGKAVLDISYGNDSKWNKFMTITTPDGNLGEGVYGNTPFPETSLFATITLAEGVEISMDEGRTWHNSITCQEIQWKTWMLNTSQDIGSLKGWDESFLKQFMVKLPDSMIAPDNQIKINWEAVGDPADDFQLGGIKVLTPAEPTPGGEPGADNTVDYNGANGEEAVIGLLDKVAVSDTNADSIKSVEITLNGYETGDQMWLKGHETNAGEIDGFSYEVKVDGDKLVLTIDASSADVAPDKWNDLIHSLQFGTTGAAGERTIDFVINDGLDDSAKETITIDVKAPAPATGGVPDVVGTSGGTADALFETDAIAMLLDATADAASDDTDASADVQLPHLREVLAEDSAADLGQSTLFADGVDLGLAQDTLDFYYLAPTHEQDELDAALQLQQVVL